MSLPEYLPTDLPQYTKVTSRAAFSSSVIESGHVLLFAENGSSGTNLVAKNPDGTYTEIGGGARTLSNPYGTITYTEAEGIRCAFFSSAGMSFSKIDDFVTGTPFSASIWFKGTSETITASVWICSPGTSGRGDAGLYIAANTDTNKFTIGSAGTYVYSTADTFDLTQWHCLCCVSDGSTISFYVDGVPQISETLWNINPDSRSGGFGRTGQYDAGLTGYLAAARAYYRALSADEIAAIASEFTSTVS